MSTGSEIVLGIDLGTTFSTAAAVIGGKVHLALDSRGEACMPSVVHFPRTGPPVVGIEADRLRATDPANTVWGIKRLIGQTADSPSARVLNAHSAFAITGQAGGGEAEVTVRNRAHPASEIAALILRHLRERAESRFQRRITKAILTVPVTATAEVKEAMLRCGRMAGLEVLRLLPEPVAGALARGIKPAHSDEAPLLVYDFGGGTFDATVVLRQGSKMRVLAAGGDDCLGGDDFDRLFSRRIADAVFKSHGVDVTHDVILWDRVQRQCEKVKRALSTAQTARYSLPEAFGVGQASCNLDVPIGREQLEPTWAELVERSIETSLQTAADAGVEPAQLGSVLLIGGTTFVPLVRKRVAEVFPRPCFIEQDPQTTVARGAALLAAQATILAA